MLRQLYLGLMLLLEVPLKLAALLGRGLLRIRSRRLGGRAVGGTGSSRLYRACQGDEVDKHCAQFFVILLCYSFVGVSSLLRMFSRLFGVRGLLSLGGMLLLMSIGVLYVVMVRVVPCLFSSSLGKLGSSASSWHL